MRCLAVAVLLFGVVGCPSTVPEHVDGSVLILDSIDLAEVAHVRSISGDVVIYGDVPEGAPDAVIDLPALEEVGGSLTVLNVRELRMPALRRVGDALTLRLPFGTALDLGALEGVGGAVELVLDGCLLGELGDSILETAQVTLFDLGCTCGEEVGASVLTDCPELGAVPEACTDWLACEAAIDAQQGTNNVSSLRPFYGEGGDCWGIDPQLRTACVDACTSQLFSRSFQFPDLPACGQADAGPRPSVEQSQECVDYLSCQVAVDREQGTDTASSLVDTYGPGGSCWTTTPEAAQACTDACGQAFDANRVAFPFLVECGGTEEADAGPPPDAGPGPEPDAGEVDAGPGPQPDAGPGFVDAGLVLDAGQTDDGGGAADGGGT